MARLGIDLGTTNTVAVASDRGRYVVVPHVVETAVGHVIRESFPSLVACDTETGELSFGLQAERRLMGPGAGRRYRGFRSLKRLLRGYFDGMRTGADLRPGGYDLLALLTGYATALRESIEASQCFEAGEPLEAVITWPANANGAQRHVTRRVFRSAGFTVVDALNEPTAAAIEFADRLAKGSRSRARRLSSWVAVFDLGGGTFDASLVRIDGAQFAVANAGGIEELGGDDFDAALARMFCERARIDWGALAPYQRELLLRHACQQKESISGGLVDALSLAPADLGLPGSACSVPVAAYFAEIRPHVERAVERLWAVVAGAFERGVGVDPARLDAVYLVGGSSRLPLVSRLIAERFPYSRLIASDKPFTSTAMGAAIRSSEAIEVREVFSRHFGVIRLADNGTREYFAPIFSAGMPLPARGAPPVREVVEYTPRHNIGHLRYLECAERDESGRPRSGIREWSDVFFPYDPGLSPGAPLGKTMIGERSDLGGDLIRETYECGSDGVIHVTVTRCRDGQSSSYELFREAECGAPGQSGAA